MILWIKLAIRELHINRGFSTFFILNLAIGLAGFIAIHSFNTSLNQSLNQNLKEILTADFVISSTRQLTNKEQQLTDNIVGKKVQIAKQIRFYTMVRGTGQTRLAQIIAIDDTFPLYGKFYLESNNTKTNLQKNPKLLMTKDTARTFGITSTNAQTLQLGKTSFTLDDFFSINPDKSITAIEFAPRIYMGIDQLQKTGLVKFGSRVRYFTYYLYPDGTDISAITENLRNTYNTYFNGQPDFNVMDIKDINRQLGRITSHFTGYLGLVSIVALFLAGIATAYLFQGYLTSKKKEIAILMSIGAKRSETLLLFTIQLIILGFLASILSVLLSIVILPIFPLILKDIIASNIQIHVQPTSAIIAFSMGILGSFIFCLPIFVRIFSVKPIFLLREDQTLSKTFVNQITYIIWFIPSIAAFWGLSIMITNSLSTGSFFTIGFLAVLIILGFIGWLVFNSCKPLSLSKHILAKIAFRNLYRNKLSSLSCFVTIAMGTFLISLIPQVQNGIQQEIERPDGLNIPAFFLIDVQDEQKQPLLQMMKKESGHLSNLSPIIRGRILLVNGTTFQDRRNQSKSSKQNFRHRRLEYNFSYRQVLDASETIIKGKPLTSKTWDFNSNAPFEISVAQSFAERNQLNIGDTMKFDVQGLSLTGIVVNIRKVRWNSFQPNFFLLFQDGVLNDAPKTYLASISGIPPADRQALKNRLVEKFSNISILDVTQMVKTILGITNRLSMSITFMAILAIAAGLVSIFSIARQEAKKQELQINLLKVLGAGFKDIYKIVMLEFGFLGFTAALFAILLSIFCSYSISLFFFDSLWKLNVTYTLLILGATTMICIITALFATRHVVKSKAIKLLNSE